MVVLLLASLGATKDSFHCQGRAQMVELGLGLFSWLVGGSFAMLFDQLVGWIVGWLGVWLVGCLVGWVFGGWGNGEAFIILSLDSFVSH